MKQITHLLLFLSFSIGSLAQKNFIDQPYLETSATADTLVVPDRVYLAIVLNEADSRNRIPVEEQEKTLEAVLKKLNINTETDLSLQELTSNYKQYFIKGQNIIKMKNYSLLVRDAVTAGKVMAELELAGISNVTIEKIEYSRADELLRLLKARAVLKTYNTAQEMAGVLNQKTGKAIRISDKVKLTNGSPGATGGFMIRGTSSLYGSRAADPLFTEFKKMKFEVEVEVHYVLE